MQLLEKYEVFNKKGIPKKRGKFLCPECGETVHYQLSRGLKKKKCYSCERYQGKKLNKDEVKDIRALYATGKFTVRELANVYKVSHNMIWLIIKKRTWKFK